MPVLVRQVVELIIVKMAHALVLHHAGTTIVRMEDVLALQPVGAIIADKVILLYQYGIL